MKWELFLNLKTNSYKFGFEIVLIGSWKMPWTNVDQTFQHRIYWYLEYIWLFYCRFVIQQNSDGSHHQTGFSTGEARRQFQVSQKRLI
jgi:hypothetical protein